MYGWYVGLTLNNYLFINAVTKGTGAMMLTDTLQFKHHTITTPTIMTTERIVKATQALKKSMEGHPNPAHPAELQ